MRRQNYRAQRQKILQRWLQKFLQQQAQQGFFEPHAQHQQQTAQKPPHPKRTEIHRRQSQNHPQQTYFRRF